MERPFAVPLAAPFAVGWPFALDETECAEVEPFKGTWTISELSAGWEAPFWQGHMVMSFGCGGVSRTRETSGGGRRGQKGEKVLVQEGIRHGRLFEEATKLDLSHWSASCDSPGHLSHSREWFARASSCRELSELFQ